MGFSRQEYWSRVPLLSPIYLLIYANLELGVWGRPNFPDTHNVVFFFFKLTSVDSKQFVVVVQSLSYFQLFTTPWTASRQASLPFTTSWSLLKLTFIESLMPSNHLILCQPRLLLPSVFPNIWFSSIICLSLELIGSPRSIFSKAKKKKKVSNARSEKWAFYVLHWP